jgi:galactokinase
MILDDRDALLEEARRLFVERFGEEPQSQAVAPARVNLIGEHTDYASGFVLPAAIPLYTCVLVSQGTGLETVLVSTKFGEAIIPATAVGQFDGFARYLAGAIQECRLEGTPLRILVHGNMPVEAGLSSSASLLVAAIAALGGGARRAPPLFSRCGSNGQAAPAELRPAGSRHLAEHETRIGFALAARAVENDYVGVPCGLMDQFVVACAESKHALLLDCLDNHHVSVRAVVPGHTWLVLYTGIRRELRDGCYGTKVEAVKSAIGKLDKVAGVKASHILRSYAPDGIQRAAKVAWVPAEHLPLLEHIVAENSRVHLMRHALERGDAQMVGTILRLGHDSLSQKFGVSLPAIDEFVRDAYHIDGVVGTRLTGAGMGGSLVMLARNGNLEELMIKVEGLARRTLSLDAEVFAVPSFVDGVSWS